VGRFFFLGWWFVGCVWLWVLWRWGGLFGSFLALWCGFVFFCGRFVLGGWCRLVFGVFGVFCGFGTGFFFVFL